ncbi:MAG: hypothetical protein K2N91_03695, partial [Muribaculaceae bacterium]|nr:hypothetical protein [Muribaculaceae bacterium]
MEINFSDKLKTALDNSRREAARHNNATVTPAHLLLALIANPASRSGSILEKIAREVSGYQLQQQLDSSLFDSQPHSSAEIAISDLANRLVRLSVLESRMMRSDVVDEEHLLMAIFHNSEVQQMEFMRP